MQCNLIWKRSLELLFAPLLACLLGPDRAMATPETFVDDCPLGVASCFADASIIVLQGPGAGGPANTLPGNFAITGNALIDQMPDPDLLQDLVLSTIGTVSFVDPNIGPVDILSASLSLLGVTSWASPGTGQLIANVNVKSSVRINGNVVNFDQNQALTGDLDILGGGINLVFAGVTIGAFSTIGNPAVDPTLQQQVIVQSNITWRGTAIPEPSAAILYAASILVIASRTRRGGALRMGRSLAG